MRGEGRKAAPVIDVTGVDPVNLTYKAMTSVISSLVQ